MRASNGAFSHDDVMRLTWRQFETYQEAFAYVIGQESEQGRKKNEEYDAIALGRDEQYKSQAQIDRDEVYRKLNKKPPPKMM